MFEDTVSRCSKSYFWRTYICYIRIDIFLSEKVGIRRWSAVFIGFVGMLLIIKPAYEELNIYYVFPIIFCIFFACVALSIRSLSTSEPNYRIALYFSVLSMLVGLCTLPFGWVMPNKFELFLLIFTGIIGSVANILLTISLRVAEASLVTPTKYLNLYLLFCSAIHLE